VHGLREEQIISVLKEHEAGAKAADLARKHGVSEATLYNWKSKYGGMDVSEARRLILLCHKFILGRLRWQQGHRNNRLARARANLMRMLAIDDATWRSGLTGGSSGLITFG
jgi:hypothetical protein